MPDESKKYQRKVANKAKVDVYLRIHANDVDSSSNTGAMTICVSGHNRFVSSKMIRKRYDLSRTILNSYVKATGFCREYVWRTDGIRKYLITG